MDKAGYAEKNLKAQIMGSLKRLDPAMIPCKE
jgi:hypothetical protein